MKIQSTLRLAALSLALSVALPQVASAQSRWVKVVNRSSDTVWVLYGTNAGNTKWGRDHLGGGCSVRVTRSGSTSGTAVGPVSSISERRRETASTGNEWGSISATRIYGPSTTTDGPL